MADSIRIIALAVLCAALVVSGCRRDTATEPGASEPSTREGSSAAEPAVDDGVPPMGVAATIPSLDIDALPPERAPILHLPASGADPVPLVVALHPYAGDPRSMAEYFGLRPLVDSGDIAVVVPRGLLDERGMPYWNATDACCDRYDQEPDDVSYLVGLVLALIERPEIDGDEVYLVGASNGAFMAYRLACEAPGLVAGVFAISGTEPLDSPACAAAFGPRIVHVHGAADPIVRYEGSGASVLDGHAGAGYPGAEETVRRWVARNGCADEPERQRISLQPRPGGPLDLVTWADCERGGSVELRRMETAEHRILPEPLVRRWVAGFVRPRR